MQTHQTQTTTQTRRRIARLRLGLDQADDISEWNRLQAELAVLTSRLRLVPLSR